MKRRTFLGTVGIGVTTISGCLSRTNPDSGVFSTNIAGPHLNNSNNTSTTDTTATEIATTEPAPPENKPGTSQPDARERIASGKRKEITIGGASVSPDGQRKPHGVILLNATDQMWVRLSPFVWTHPGANVKINPRVRPLSKRHTNSNHKPQSTFHS